MILAIQTGLSNARGEGFNRIVKHIGRVAFGFRTPENQRRRVRWACPPITASAIHQTAAPLLTRMSRRSGPEPPERRDQGPKLGRDCLTATPTMRNHSGRKSSSIGGRRSAICEPTIAKNSALCPIGSGISDSSCAANCGRSAARSATFRALNSEASRAASLSVKVLWSWRGASSRTASRCALVMVRTRSASEAILDVSCRAAKLDTSPPSFSRTSAASWSIGCATTAWVPALDALKSGI